MDDDTQNPYLALRAKKIARNEARLAALGLLSNRSSTTTTTSSGRSRTNTRRPSPRSVVTPSPMPTRRSARITSRPLTYSTEPTTTMEPARRTTKRPRRQVMVTMMLNSSNHNDDTNNDDETMIPPVSSPVYPPCSVRNMVIHAETLVLGVLGARMEHTGKAFVMEEAVRRCPPSSDELSVPSKLSFNKYSGVQEWKNDTMFLWVNLGGKGDVVNDFLDNGRQITWFGGSRMHDESNVIRRLLRVGKKAASGVLPADCGLVLWVRLFDASTKTFTPYHCLGRLSYHSHEPGSRPIQFVWNLVDYNRLMEQIDEDSDLFRYIMTNHP